jgi:2-succinyl-6-hydroxy-2,4-cyclohexadiene-1-carboxylate synthase
MLTLTRAGVGTRLALVHGFTQTGASWAKVADDLCRDHEVVCLDAPGHGGSSATRADLRTAGELVGEAAGVATYIGYSMGGRICLHLALSQPELVERLVVLGATAGIVDAAERAARLQSDRVLADRIESIGVEAFLDEWLAQPMFAALGNDPADRATRLANEAPALAEALRRMGTGAQAPLWDDLDRLSMPVLVMAGERDEKFTAIARMLAERIGSNATFAAVADAGHGAHLETPARFLQIVRQWLLATDS